MSNFFLLDWLTVAFWRGTCLFALLSTLLSTVLWGKEERPLLITVPIPPYKYIVDRLMPTVETFVLLPLNKDMHHYDCAPGDKKKILDSVLWISLGESFERKVLQSLGERTQVKKLVLAEHTNLIYPENISKKYKQNHASGDLHFWLSPSIFASHVTLIAEHLKSVVPEQKGTIEKNAKQLHQELVQLHQWTLQKLKKYHGLSVVVGHPSLSYFCQDYGLKQLSLEGEGKDPLLREILDLLDSAQDVRVCAIFSETQRPSRALQLFAEKSGKAIKKLQPFAYEYIENMRKIVYNVQE